MPNTLDIPEHPLERFRAVYEALARGRRWHQCAASLRFSAISALTIPGDSVAVARAIRHRADEIKKRAGVFSAFNSELRFIVAVILLQNDDSVTALRSEIKRVRALFRQEGLPRSRGYEAMAILVMRINAGLAPISSEAVHRFASVFEHLKQYHPWLTRTEDYPTCAVLAARQEHPQQIAGRIEDIYNAIHKQKFSKGNHLQTAANILYLSNLDTDLLSRRFAGLAQGFRQAGIAIWQSDYEELALLSFLAHPTHRVVDRVVQYRESMSDLRPKPDRSLTFNLACSIAFLELIQRSKDMKRLVDVKSLLDMQHLIEAQAAAAAAS